VRSGLQPYMAWSYDAILAGFDGTPSPEKSAPHEFCLAGRAVAWLHHNGGADAAWALSTELN
jgi:hypothetical protein